MSSRMMENILRDGFKQPGESSKENLLQECLSVLESEESDEPLSEERLSLLSAAGDSTMNSCLFNDVE